MTDSRFQPNIVTARGCVIRYAELWQERAPQGPWFVSTPHDDHIFFGQDTDSAKQCVSAINRPAEEIATLKARIEELEANERAYEAIFGKRTYNEVALHIKELENPFRAVDEIDWAHLDQFILQCRTRCFTMARTGTEIGD